MDRIRSNQSCHTIKPQRIVPSIILGDVSKVVNSEKGWYIYSLTSKGSDRAYVTENAVAKG